MGRVSALDIWRAAGLRGRAFGSSARTVDAVGTTTYAYHTNGLLLTDGGLLANDTVTNGSHYRKRVYKIGTKSGSGTKSVQNRGQIYTLLQCESGKETESVPHFRMLPLSDSRRPA